MDSKKHRIGLIGLDTSHVIAFAKIFNDPASKDRIDSGVITVGFPGASPDFDFSRDRVEGFTKDLREKFNVKMVESPEAVAEQSDLVFISSVDGRKHLDFFKRVVNARKPVFIDKPFTTTFADAKEIARLAETAGVPVMSSSSLRYDEDLERVLTESAADSANPIVGIDVFGPMAPAPPIPLFFWYGIHSAEIMVRVLGTGCHRVQAASGESYNLLTLQWRDGRSALFRGLREAHSRFGATIHRKKDFVAVEFAGKGRSPAARMMDAVMASLPHGKSAVPMTETLEVIRILEAAEESRTTSKAVDL